MLWVYESVQGDTWDALAYDFYGSGNLTYLLLRANPKYHDLIVLPAGLEIIVPQLPKGKRGSGKPKPPWAG